VKVTSVNPFARTITSGALKNFAKVFAVVAPINLDCFDSATRKQVGVTLVKLNKPTKTALGRIPHGRRNTVAGAWAFHSVMYQSMLKLKGV
jgi:hypothetical protein